MKKEFKVPATGGFSPQASRRGDARGEKSLKLKVYAFFLCCVSLVFLCLLVPCEAKIYIDITSPAFQQLMIAIPEFSGHEGKTISNIIKNDLEFTGFFKCIDESLYIETSSHGFNPQNWTLIGAEAVIKGSIAGEQSLSVTVNLYDIYEGKEILKKTYITEKPAYRVMAHTIANDIYKELTGEKGIFKTRVAFVAEDEGKKGLFIMDWDGSNLKRLGIRGNFVLSPHWSKSGDKLAYSSERNGQWGVYLLDFTKMTEKKLFASRGLNITGNFFPDENEIVFASSKDETYGFYLLRISDLWIKRITTSRWIEVSPYVSPDGSSIAFVSDKGGTPQIYIMDKKGYSSKRLTFEGSYNTSPNWSPLGDRIAFVGRASGAHQIFTIKTDGTELTQLTFIGNNEDPSFSPDGRFIIFTSDRYSTSSIYIMRANGESQKRITPVQLKAFGPKWSPN